MTSPDDPVPPPMAFCAPGLREQAERILRDRGEEFLRVEETPCLEGFSGVVLAASALPGALPPLALDVPAATRWQLDEILGLMVKRSFRLVVTGI
jgi:hypothetical protein